MSKECSDYTFCKATTIDGNSISGIYDKKHNRFWNGYYDVELLNAMGVKIEEVKEDGSEEI